MSRPDITFPANIGWPQPMKTVLKNFATGLSNRLCFLLTYTSFSDSPHSNRANKFLPDQSKLRFSFDTFILLTSISDLSSDLSLHGFIYSQLD